MLRRVIRENLIDISEEHTASNITAKKIIREKTSSTQQVASNFTDISGEFIASIFRVEK
jgi:hypothetical protein